MAREALPESFEMSLNELLRRAEIDWHGVRLGEADWSDDSHSLACTVRPGRRYFPFWLHMIFNSYWEPLDFELPILPATAVSSWQRWIDTALESPEDIVDADAAPLVSGTHYRVMPRSMAALFLRIASPPGVPA